MSEQFVASWAAPDLLAGSWQLTERWWHGKTALTGECQACRGTLGTNLGVLKPRGPEHKGIILHAQDYLESSFLSGRQLSPGRTTSTPS